ncbi:MAG: MFS transporter [Promethearchaeati archaeon SRVP18_Atabeyarchaeia-1]
MVSLIWRVNIATMLFFTLVQLVVPLIPWYAKTITGDEVLIGIAVGSISITAILLRPLSGIASDRWSRSGLMILGLLLASFAYFNLFYAGDMLHVTIARLIEGTGVAAFVPSSIASAVDQAPEGKLGETLGWRSLMIGIGFLVGPSVGGPLAYVLGFRATFMISSFLLISLIPLVIFKGADRKPSREGSSIAGLKEGNFIIAFIALIIYALAWMGLYTFLVIYLSDAHYQIYEITIWVAIQAVFSLALRVVAGKAADKRPAMMAYAGLLTMSLALMIVFLTRFPPYFYIAAPIYGIGIGTYVPGSQTLALMKCPARNRGLLASVYTMGLDIGTLVGPISFALILQATNDYSYLFFLAPVLMLVSAIVVMVATTVLRRRNNECL